MDVGVSLKGTVSEVYFIFQRCLKMYRKDNNNHWQKKYGLNINLVGKDSPFVLYRLDKNQYSDVWSRVEGRPSISKKFIVNDEYVNCKILKNTDDFSGQAGLQGAHAIVYVIDLQVKDSIKKFRINYFKRLNSLEETKNEVNKRSNSNNPVQFLIGINNIAQNYGDEVFNQAKEILTMVHQTKYWSQS